MNNRPIALFATSALCTIACAMPLAAHAQAEPPVASGGDATAPAATPATAQSGLQDIIVTAQRRTQNLQNVPLSIVAVGPQQIQERNIQTLEGLNTIVPNAAIEHVGLFPNAAALSMRGVGYAGIESFADPEVAVYVNGIYQSRNSAALGTTVDVSSIEVLRGPQGTLYGRNAFAGVITLNTVRPNMTDTSAEAILGVGNFGLVNADMILNVPLAQDKISARIAFRFHNLDGYYTNNGVGLDQVNGSYTPARPTSAPGVAASQIIDNTLKGRSVGGEKYLYVRPTLRFTPTDELDINLIGEYYRDRSDAGAVLHLPLAVLPGTNNNYGTATTAGFVLQNMGGGLTGSNPFGAKGQKGDGSDPYKIGELSGRPSNFDTYNLTLDAAYKTEIGTIRALANYQNSKSEIWTNSDGENINRFTSGRWENYKSYSAELQFASDFSDWFDMVAGVLALHDSYETTQFTFNIANGPPYPAVFDLTNVNLAQIGYANNHGKRTSYAAFAQGEFHFTQQLSLVLGGRYTTERKYGYAGQNTNLVVAGFDATIDPSQHPFSSNTAIIFTAPAKRWNNFAPRAGVNFKANDDLMLYAFWQRAFKSGGFNANSADRNAFITPFGVERVDSFEGGFKSEWFDRRLRVNLNVFYSKFKGLQRSLVTPTPTSPSGVTTVTTNAANLTSYGVEAEIVAKPVERTTLFANIGWNKAYYTSYCADLDGAEPTTTPSNGRAVCGAITPVGVNFLVPTDNSVLKPIRAPRWDISAGVSQQFQLPNATLDASVSGNYRSGQWTIITNLPYGYRDSMFVLDGSLRYQPDGGHYTVTLWGRNLTNRVDLLNYSSTGAFGFGNPTLPRTFGGTVDVKF